MKVKQLALAVIALFSISAHAQFMSPVDNIEPVVVPGLIPDKKPPVPPKKTGPTTVVSTSQGSNAPLATGPSLPPAPPLAAAAKNQAAQMMQQLVEQQGQFKIPSPNANDAINVTPGVTEVIPVSRAYLTRIATPFANPSVETSSAVEAKVKGSSLYVTIGDEPVGLFIADKSDPDNVISVQLVPRDIPQRDVKLTLRGVSSTKASRSMEALPYVQELSTISTELARGKIPTGFAMDKAKGYEISCAMPGMQLRLAQVMTGSNYRIGVFAVRNTTTEAAEINEQACNDRNVAAVAAYPDNVIQPGQRTELYVITTIPAPADPTDRASVLQ
jgi:conjugal transfer pilus assembly protein TraK